MPLSEFYKKGWIEGGLDTDPDKRPILWRWAWPFLQKTIWSDLRDQASSVSVIWMVGVKNRKCANNGLSSMMVGPSLSRLCSCRLMPGWLGCTWLFFFWTIVWCRFLERSDFKNEGPSGLDSALLSKAMKTIPIKNRRTLNEGCRIVLKQKWNRNQWKNKEAKKIRKMDKVVLYFVWPPSRLNTWF